MLAIYKKELRSYFNSMIGYVFMAFFLLIIGVYFFVQNLFYGYANFEYTLSSITFIFVILAPLLTMRLMAEENKQKTDQLLLTSPVTATSIVVGKLLAVFSLYGFIMLITCFYPLILSLYGTVTFATAYSSILAFTLMGGAYLAIGLFISSLTDSQIVAAVISFVVFLLTILMDGIAGVLPTDNKSAVIIFTAFLLILCIILYRMMHNLTIAAGIGVIGEAALVAAYLLKPTFFDGSVANVLGWLSIVKRFDNFYYGIFDVAGLVYYVSIAGLFTFLTVQVIKKKRWS
ncbi:MAG TPA: ABC transporter permease [Clostridiales bacterium]|nr:ABC transporter permease [Clostridiales bacterium]